MSHRRRRRTTWAVAFTFRLSDGTTLYVERTVKAADRIRARRLGRTILARLGAPVPKGRIVSVTTTVTRRASEHSGLRTGSGS